MCTWGPVRSGSRASLAGHCRKLPWGLDIDDWWNFSWRLHSNNKPLDTLCGDSRPEARERSICSGMGDPESTAAWGIRGSLRDRAARLVRGLSASLCRSVKQRVTKIKSRGILKTWQSGEDDVDSSNNAQALNFSWQTAVVLPAESQREDFVRSKAQRKID